VTAVARMTSEVTERTGRLESPAEASAVLEALGYTDAGLAELGLVDVFHAGVEVYEHQYEDATAGEERRAVERERRELVLEERRPTSLRTFLPRFALKGFTFGAPMLLMLLSVLVLLYSLWAYFYFDVPRGSAIAAGIVASYLVTGGFMQAIGRRGLMYLRQDMFGLALRVCLLLVAIGFGTVVVSGLLFWLLLLIFPLVAPSQVPIAILYFFTLSCLWLGLSIVYMMQQEIWFSICVGLGIALVYFCREYLRTGVVFAHTLGIMFAALFGLAVGTILLLRGDRKVQSTRKQPLAGSLPRLSVLAYSVAPYFLYGLLYFAFLFTDRILAWTGKTPFRQSFVWFQSDYEVGLNWALVTLLLSFSVLEFTVFRLAEELRYFAEVHSVLHIKRYTDQLLGFYRKSVLAYVISAVVGIILGYVLVRYALAPHVPLVGVLINRVAITTFFISAVAYVLVVWGLLNNAFLFSLSRPSYAIRSVAPALVVDLVVGLLASRLIAYWAAAFGLLAGGIVFWLLSTYYAMKILKRVGYYAYSAF